MKYILNNNLKLTYLSRIHNPQNFHLITLGYMPVRPIAEYRFYILMRQNTYALTTRQSYSDRTVGHLGDGFLCCMIFFRYNTNLIFNISVA